MAAYVARHVVWYRVHRLGDDDVEPLIRLAVAGGAGRHGPVGFIVDGVGTGSLTGWDELHRRAAAVPGVLLLGSVREEDTLPLQTFGQCVVVRPRLDEDLAVRIHKGLLGSGATKQPHWLETYNQADGLTLEFTHLLTRGRRLGDVIADQVRDRVRDHRTVELAVIAPVSIAHRWGAALSVTRLAEVINASAGELKEALTRLADEHLVTVDGGVVRGLHPVRSPHFAKRFTKYHFRRSVTLFATSSSESAPSTFSLSWRVPSPTTRDSRPSSSTRSAAFLTSHRVT